MYPKSVFCIVDSRTEADKIVAILKVANFSSKDISVLLPDEESNDGYEHERDPNAPKEADVVAGGVIGGALGWIAGIATIAIPGVGPLLAAGPIVAVLSSAAIGTAVGVAAGGITAGLVSFGISENEAKRYDGMVRKGSVLIAVHTENGEEITRAKDIFQKAGAEDFCSPAENYARGAPASGNVGNTLP